MEDIFIGSQALRTGDLTGYQLRTECSAIYPNVYAPAYSEPSLRTRTKGAWLWSGKRGTVAGLAAAALLGSQWIDDGVPIELIWRNTHPPDELIVRNDRLHDDEVTWRTRLPVTSPERTAFDLGRYLLRNEAIARLDALMYATSFAAEDVLLLAKRYAGARGLKSLRRALPLADGGAASPQETRLRLLFIDAGLPRPTTQIAALDHNGRLLRMLDMGWEEFMVAAEYDGDLHRTNRRKYVKDMRVLPKIERMGWHVIRAIKEDRDEDIIQRARTALISRGWRP